MRYSIIQVLMLSMLFMAANTVLAQDNTTTDLVLGEPHPTLGGYIFHLNGAEGGLIVYDNDLTNDDFDGLSMFRWAEPEHLRTDANVEHINFNNWEVTSTHTDSNIIDAFGDVGSYAALSIKKQLGDEWRLPTSTEAYWMHFNLNKNGQGEFARAVYWTSSEVLFDKAEIVSPYAVAIDMTTGKILPNMAKIQALRIRPVRSF